MSIFLLMTGFAFWIENRTARVAVVALGIYCALSPKLTADPTQCFLP